MSAARETNVAVTATKRSTTSAAANFELSLANGELFEDRWGERLIERNRSAEPRRPASKQESERPDEQTTERLMRRSVTTSSPASEAEESIPLPMKDRSDPLISSPADYFVRLNRVLLHLLLPETSTGEGAPETEMKGTR